MKRHRYQLAIDSPCTQDWYAMTESAQGKFCDHCSTAVIDFTQLSDTEIIKIIEQSSGKLCGRLDYNQVNRIIETKQVSRLSKLYKILAGLILFNFTEDSIAQTQTPTHIEVVSNAEKKYLKEAEPNKKTEPTFDIAANILQGIVIDSITKLPLDYASVFIEGTFINVNTDSNGIFKIIIPDSLKTKNFNLVVRYIGYRASEIVIKKGEYSQSKIIMMRHPMASELHMVGAVCIKKKKWWQRR